MLIPGSKSRSGPGDLGKQRRNMGSCQRGKPFQYTTLLWRISSSMLVLNLVVDLQRQIGLSSPKDGRTTFSATR